MFFEEGDRSRNGVPTGWRVSQQQHAVAVAVKPVALENCVPVSTEGEFAPGKGADQQEERGPGQVKVREECARDLKLEARVDEEAGFTSSGNDPAAVLARDVFERAHARGATAMTRRPSSSARLTALAAKSEISKRSLSILWSSTRSARTGWKVPSPTWSVISEVSTPRARSSSSTRSVK